MYMHTYALSGWGSVENKLSIMLALMKVLKAEMRRHILLKLKTRQNNGFLFLTLFSAWAALLAYYLFTENNGFFKQ